MVESLAGRFPLIHWLLADAPRIGEPKAFLSALAQQLGRCGVDVARMTTGVPILHPQVHSYSALWDAEKGTTDRYFRLTAETLPQLENSPVKIVYGGGGPVRCDPSRPPREGEFTIMADLRRDGFTDYLALPVPFSDGTSKLLSVATKRSGGFTDSEVALLESITSAVAVNMEVQALRFTARTLLETYVGRQAGARVLEGAIRRGMGETIRAVVWLSDLRDFTELSERLPRDELITLLNQYFGGVCDCLDAAGGEVLKFIGDSVLAIFPVQAEEERADVCARAVSSAIHAREALAAVNAGRLQAGQPQISFGIALHTGDVLYGNIGGESRLDFTVIGPAVNLAARIESMCRELRRPILMSRAFVEASHLEAEHVGTFVLKGLAEPQSIYAPT
jgi:adenylate cyclase